MAKRMQEQEEERIVAKSKPTMNLVSLVSRNSSTVQNPTASKSPEILTAPCRKDWSNTGKFEAKITQSRRSVEFPRMAKGCATVHKHRETCSNRQGSEISECQEKSAINTGELVATEYQGCSEIPEIPEGSEDSEPKSRSWPHHLRISPHYVDYMEKVFSTDG